MTLDLYLAPFLAKLALLVDQEGAAFDTHELSPVKGLFLDDVELAAEFFVRIRQQLKGKLVLCFELLVRGNAVA